MSDLDKATILEAKHTEQRVSLMMFLSSNRHIPQRGDLRNQRCDVSSFVQVNSAMINPRQLSLDENDFHPPIGKASCEVFSQSSFKLYGSGILQ